MAGESAGDLKGLSKKTRLIYPQRLLHRLGKKEAVKKQMMSAGAQHRCCCLCSLFSEFISILCAFMFDLIVDDDRLKNKMKSCVDRATLAKVSMKAISSIASPLIICKDYNTSAGNSD